MFITGAGNGIGQATARRFGGRGAVVIVTDRDRATAAA
ncbi:SDR family NAD(P)-dependent oxidoreductase, partial [Mycobacterium kansasii]